MRLALKKGGFIFFTSPRPRLMAAVDEFHISHQRLGRSWCHATSGPSRPLLQACGNCHCTAKTIVSRKTTKRQADLVILCHANSHGHDGINVFPRNRSYINGRYAALTRRAGHLVSAGWSRSSPVRPPAMMSARTLLNMKRAIRDGEHPRRAGYCRSGRVGDAARITSSQTMAARWGQRFSYMLGKTAPVLILVLSGQGDTAGRHHCGL